MKQLLVLNVAPALEEALVDYLLESAQEGFTSFAVRGHGEHDQLSIAEQVSGRRKRTQFELMMDEDRVDDLLEGLRKQVGTDIVWWLSPVVRHGRV